MKKNLWNTKEGNRLAEMTFIIANCTFNDIKNFDKNGKWIPIKGNSPEWVTLVRTVESGIKKAKEILKDKSISLNQKISKMWTKLQELSNEELVTLNALVEYKINLNYYGSQCCINWYNLTDACIGHNMPIINSKWGYNSNKGGWVEHYYKTNPFNF